MYDALMSETIGFVVNCGAAECSKRISVKPSNIGLVILSAGEANVFASVSQEDSCYRPDCGQFLGFASTENTESILWLIEHVEPERCREL